jgi:hypothetical protein
VHIGIPRYRYVTRSRHDLPTLRFRAVPPPHRWRRRLLLDQHLAQLPEIAVIEKPADRIRRDLACALRIERAAQTRIQDLDRRQPAKPPGAMEKAARLDHHHTSSTATEMTIGQPEELRRFQLLGHAASIGRGLCRFKRLWRRTGARRAAKRRRSGRRHLVFPAICVAHISRYAGQISTKDGFPHPCFTTTIRASVEKTNTRLLTI